MRLFVCTLHELLRPSSVFSLGINSGTSTSLAAVQSDINILFLSGEAAKVGYLVPTHANRTQYKMVVKTPLSRHESYSYVTATGSNLGSMGHAKGILLSRRLQPWSRQPCKSMQTRHCISWCSTTWSCGFDRREAVILSTQRVHHGCPRSKSKSRWYRLLYQSLHRHVLFSFATWLLYLCFFFCVLKDTVLLMRSIEGVSSQFFFFYPWELFADITWS